MFYGGYKRIDFSGTREQLIAFLFFLAQLFGLYFFVQGFSDQHDGFRLSDPELHWGMKTSLSAVVICFSWFCATFLILKFQENEGLKTGALILNGLPFVLFCLFIVRLM